MKTTLKRVLSMALALVLLVGALPMGAQAYTHTVGTHQFEIDATGHECMTEGCRDLFHDRKMDHDDTLFNSPADGVCAVCEYPCMNGHNMSDATCTVPATCTRCGKTVGTVDGHNWNDATCTAPKTCADCGATEGTVSHEGEEEEVRDAVAATCTAAGYTGDVYCKGCNTKLSTGTAIPKLAHEDADNDHVCDKGCNARLSQHIGGTKTCAEKATCDTCGEEYGDTLPHEAPADAEWESDETHHWKECSCGGRAEEAEHTFRSALLRSKVTCTVCGYEDTANDDEEEEEEEEEETTPPVVTNKYKVYYNLNVDEDSKVNKPFNTYDEGTYLATIVQALKTMEGSTIKFPGLFESWFYVEGWYVDGIKVTDGDTRVLTKNTVFYAKWKQKYNYEVILKLYTNGNTNTVVKVIDAFDYVQDDGKLSQTEVTKIANEYIKSNNGHSLTIYGPFKSGQQWDNYCQYPNRLTGTEYVEVDPSGTTIVHAMVHNAKINSSSSSTGKKADSTNPKTGDMIMVPVAVMGVSVSALAVMFYLKKKRTI